MTLSKHYINGAWLAGTGPTFSSENPATGEIIWEGNEAGDKLVDDAIQAAHDALTSWADLDLSARIRHLQAYQELLTKEKQSIAKAISQENGKPLWEALTEVSAMINKVPISIEAYKMRCAEIFKEHPSGKTITRHRPHGVMAVLGPFNFPGHIPSGHIIPALLAGNTIVLKPSEITPRVAELTIKIWEASGLPKGVINLVQGGRNTGARLSSHPKIDGILFTGSWNTGLILSQLLAKTPHKIIALEMGGNNPLIVSRISDYRAAAYLTIQSAYLTSGQRCTCARRLIVPNGAAGDAFLKALIDMTKSIRIGAYNESPEPFMGPVISKQAAEMLLKVQLKLISLGGRPLLSMEQLAKYPSFLSPGLIDVTDIADRSDEENFGPLLQLVRVPTFAAAIDEANHTQYGLTAGLLSDSQEEFDQFSKQIRAGVINWNTPTTGATSSAPFGGIGHSGNNRPSGFYAADYCAYPVALNEGFSLAIPPQITPGIGLVKEPSHES